MNILYGWSIKRAGAAMTIEHSTGKITGVASVAPLTEHGPIIAALGDGTEYFLAMTTAATQPAADPATAGGEEAAG